MNKVLIALDYDPSAQKVAEQGFALARALRAETILLHVISDPDYYASTKHIIIMGFAGTSDEESLQLDSLSKRKKFAQNFLNKSKAHLGDDLIQTLVAEGDFAESILTSARDLDAKLIVMGSHSRKWLQNIVLGSVSEKVLHHTSIPVLVIPTRRK
jgi:nucleotide-binding universal stress UspA family protein